MIKRIDKDGETIMVSEGLEDMDPESLVEPAQLPLEEIEEREQSLGVKVSLRVVYLIKGLRACEDPLLYKGILRKIDHRVWDSVIKDRWVERYTAQRIDLTMSVENALEFIKFATHPDYNLKLNYTLNYVFKEDNADLKSKYDEPDSDGQTVLGVTVSDIKNSTCLCSVLLKAAR